MEVILRQQDELEHRISRTGDNIRKLGTAKVTIDVLNARLEQLTIRWLKYQANHDMLTTDHLKLLEAHVYWTDDALERVEEDYFAQREYITSWKRKLQPAEEKPVAPAATQPPAHGRSQLPSIEIPHFNGSYQDWPTFRDLFRSIVDKKATLDDAEKFHYLRTSIEGEADELIRNLPPTGDNYRRAWELLVTRYENKRILVRSFLTTFTATPKMKGESASELHRIVRVLNNTEKSLEGIDRPITSSEDLIVHLTIEMLDPTSRKEWENTINRSPEPPALETLKEFLERRLQTLVALEPTKTTSTSGKRDDKSRKDNSNTSKSHHAGKSERPKPRCLLCKREHYLMTCDAYRRKNAADRRNLVDSNNLCTNCLGNHKTDKCQSKRSCSVCDSRHHSTLHEAFQESSSPSTATSTAPVTNAAHTVQKTCLRPGSVLLATARIRVADRFGNHHEARALIDQGSESSFIAENLVQRLKLTRSRTTVSVLGIGGQKTSSARGRTSLTIESRQGHTPIVTSALILPTLSAYVGWKGAQATRWIHLDGIDLADPDYTNNDPIEVLLGADVYAVILRPGLRRNRSDEPVAQKTSLGWILSGPVGSRAGSTTPRSFQCIVTESLDEQVRRFWEQEELVVERPKLTAEEEACEKHFLETYSRQPDGRYVVRLPLSGTIPDLSDTRRIAQKRLLSMENRFKRDERISSLYTGFMSQYLSLGHMTAVEQEKSPPNRVCYLPHHGVLKEASTSTKLRVVFDGSATTSSGDSINKHLYAGPNLLPMLFDLLLSWRTHRIVLAADVEKMFRQVLVHPDDRDLQRILWRDPETGEIAEYRLNTVTYGHNCAPFLACRTRIKLADDEEETYPRGAQALREDVYVDDVLTGAETPEEAENLLTQLRDICMAGGFPLRKWSSNDPAVLRSVPEEDRQLQCKEWDPDVNHPTLGLRWHPGTDTFSFSVAPMEMADVTKRTVLSQTARLFDPMGWLAPITIYAKILIQSLWLQGLGWDDPVPGNDAERWRSFHQELSTLQEIRIPRFISAGNDQPRVELHGFADASERAYATVLYVRDPTLPENSRVQLVAAKSKVAPLRQVSLPRLELAALTLLAQQVKHVRSVLNLQGNTTHLWSDSTVALHWVRAHPVRWTTYVANRVSSIQSAVPDARWHHVPGRDNPADCASRGLYPHEFISHPLWWTGPPWLKDDSEGWPNTRLTDPGEEAIERRSNAHHVKAERPPPESHLLTDCSSLCRLLRITARCNRWLNRAARSSLIITTEERDLALHRWIRNVQAAAFRDNIRALQKGEHVPNHSPLLKLQPFLDNQGILRVGGRLKHSLLAYDEKHPKILPRSSHLTKLLVADSHERTLHGGTQVTLAHLRRNYWIPQGRTIVKAHILRCTRCIRWRTARAQQLMGDLPAPRVTPGRPFLHVGVDYAGPYMLRVSKGRGLRRTKAFLAIFVCMTTKATHLDIVSDYTADAFLAAFRRFTARRGLCKVVYSDCGTTFIGADRQLRELFAAQGSENGRIAQWMTAEQVKWEFNPPSAPHFGGLWEAAVKSVKRHLRRVIGDTALTFEEMSTLLAQIEACLNSRPLQPLTDDPDDLTALTPGHFLIGTALLAVPELTLTDTPTNRLSRWQLLQQMRDHFWDRWSKEYLTTLQHRPKWQRKSEEYSRDRLCLIRGENLPPSKWPLARIVETHPGSDGIVRVVSLRTANATFQRPIVKVVLLPLAETE